MVLVDPGVAGARCNDELRNNRRVSGVAEGVEVDDDQEEGVVGVALAILCLISFSGILSGSGLLVVARNTSFSLVLELPGVSGGIV